MRTLSRALVPCAIVALSASCETSRITAPFQRTIEPALIGRMPGGLPPSGGVSLSSNENGSAFARAPSAEPGACPNDSKLLNGGPTLVFGDGDGTWWGLVIHGLNSAGLVTDAQKIAYLNQVFGTSFGTLTQLEVYNLNQLSEIWDLNQNGYVCAFEQRGTRAYRDDPFSRFTYFGVSDDKVAKP